LDLIIFYCYSYDKDQEFYEQLEDVQRRILQDDNDDASGGEGRGIVVIGLVTTTVLMSWFSR
jgi:hypothetical protein